MNRVESRKRRSVMGTLSAGEEVVSSLVELARTERVRAGWVRAFGQLEWVELAGKRMQGPFDLLSLEGSIALEDGEPAVRACASVARRGDNGIEVLGGWLDAAAAMRVEVLLDCFEDARVERDAEPFALGEESGDPETLSPPKPPVTWADVASAAEAPVRGSRFSEPPTQLAPRVRLPSSPPDDHVPARGDWIDHKQFGLCRVDKEDSDGGLVIRPTNGPRKFIKLDVLEVGPPRMEDGKRIFPVRPRRR